jgi:hypothetical protein
VVPALAAETFSFFVVVHFLCDLARDMVEHSCTGEDVAL